MCVCVCVCEPRFKFCTENEGFICVPALPLIMIVKPPWILRTDAVCSMARQCLLWLKTCKLKCTDVDRDYAYTIEAAGGYIGDAKELMDIKGNLVTIKTVRCFPMKKVKFKMIKAIAIEQIAPFKDDADADWRGSEKDKWSEENSQKAYEDLVKENASMESMTPDVNFMTEKLKQITNKSEEKAKTDLIQEVQEVNSNPPLRANC